MAVIFLQNMLLPYAVNADETESWFLMARHGECQKINILQRKIPEIDGINNPESFIKLMESLGHKAIVKKLEGLEGKAVQINVPARGLALMFVKKSICKEIVKK